MSTTFKKATRLNAFLRMAIHGPSGSGKTYSALAIASELARLRGGELCLFDTEEGSASKYDHFDFSVCEIRAPFSPTRIPTLLADAEKAGFKVCVLDSMTHFWKGEGGFLSMVDDVAKAAAARGNGRKVDTFAAWKEVDPVYRAAVSAILNARMDVIVTMRSKTEYEKGADGKVTKLGLAPEMREGFEYEMDIEAAMTNNHDLIVGKTRCRDLDRRVERFPGPKIAADIYKWLVGGTAPQRDTSTPPHLDKVRAAASAAKARGAVVREIAAVLTSRGGTLSKDGIVDFPENMADAAVIALEELKAPPEAR